MMYSAFSLAPPAGPAENAGQRKSLVNEDDTKPWKALNLPDGEWTNFEKHRASVKSLARKGIPKDYRHKVWFYASGAYALKSNAPAGYYASMAASTSNLADEVIYVIEEEVRNISFSLPCFPFLKTARSTEGLSRILLAFASRNPYCGYFKGIHFLAGIIWAMLGRDHEEDAFWVLNALIEKILLPTFAGELNPALKIEVAVLDAFVSQKLPQVSSHFSKILGSKSLSQITSSWFSTGFVSVLPIQVVLRIWDCAFVEGSKVVHRFALALLKVNATCVTSCIAIDTMSRVLENRIRKSEVEPLLHAAFRGIGSFPKSQVLVHRTAAVKSIMGSSISLITGNVRPSSAPHGSSNVGDRVTNAQRTKPPAPASTGIDKSATALAPMSSPTSLVGGATANVTTLTGGLKSSPSTQPQSPPLPPPAIGRLARANSANDSTAQVSAGSAFSAFLLKKSASSREPEAAKAAIASTNASSNNSVATSAKEAASAINGKSNNNNNNNGVNTITRDNSPDSSSNNPVLLLPVAPFPANGASMSPSASASGNSNEVLSAAAVIIAAAATSSTTSSGIISPSPSRTTSTKTLRIHEPVRSASDQLNDVSSVAAALSLDGSRVSSSSSIAKRPLSASGSASASALASPLSTSAAKGGEGSGNSQPRLPGGARPDRSRSNSNSQLLPSSLSVGAAAVSGGASHHHHHHHHDNSSNNHHGSAGAGVGVVAGGKSHSQSGSAAVGGHTHATFVNHAAHATCPSTPFASSSSTAGAPHSSLKSSANSKASINNGNNHNVHGGAGTTPGGGGAAEARVAFAVRSHSGQLNALSRDSSNSGYSSDGATSDVLDLGHGWT